jgi:transmembrane sensor
MKTQAPKLNRQILEEASDWFVDFRIGDVDSQARERFDEWLRRSPEHIRAYMEIAKTYVALPALTPNRKIDVQELIAYARSEDNIVPFDHTPPSRPSISPGVETSPKRQGPWFGRGLLAASIALFCLTGGIGAWWATHRFPSYETDIGERRVITLSDGSTIDLNARSKVRIRFSKGERDVQLLDGQALFAVAKDASRPFLVHTGSAVVRAVGTEFDVYRKVSGTTVTVVEGRVSVMHEGSAAVVTTRGAPTESQATLPEPTFVSAGEQVTVTERAIPKPKKASIVAATAWTQRELVFDASPLVDVVDGFNRYNTRQLVIEDADLKNFHVSGVYSSTDPASLIRFLREQPGVRVIENDADIRITRQ